MTVVWGQGSLSKRPILALSMTRCFGILVARKQEQVKKENRATIYCIIEKEGKKKGLKC